MFNVFGKITSSIAEIFGYVLNFIYKYVGNYGLAIILFSFILKIIMLPFSIMQQKSMKKSQIMQAKVNELNEKYSNDKERLNQEVVNLYKREKTSPFSGCSGCLVALFQFIIIISVYCLVRQPLTYMVRMDNNKINEYTKIVKEDYSNYTKRGNHEIAIIKESRKNDEIDKKANINMYFLGIDLSDIPINNLKDYTIYIIPGLYVLSSIISSKLTTKLSKSKKNENGEISEAEEMTAQMNKQMSFIIPIMSVSISLVVPLGMALYWLVNNILLTVERIVLNKFYD